MDLWEKMKGDQNCATVKCIFWDIDFKLIVKKQKIQKEALTLLFLAYLREESMTLVYSTYPI